MVSCSLRKSSLVQAKAPAPQRHPGSKNRTSEGGRYKGSFLLQLRAGAEIARVQRLAAGVAFILPVIIADAVFAEPPAQVNFLVVHNGRGKDQSRHKCTF